MSVTPKFIETLDKSAWGDGQHELIFSSPCPPRLRGENPSCTAIGFWYEYRSANGEERVLL